MTRWPRYVTGLTDPIATNSSESGRRVNRRVFVTIVHVFIFRS